MQLRRLVSIFAAAALAACGSGNTASVSDAARTQGGGPSEAEKAAPGKPLTVMTRNLYVGGDLFLPFTSQDPLGAASTVWGDILASDPAGRMAAIADEIAGARPDLVGLEEAYRFVVTPLGKQGPVLLDLDFLALLGGALDSPGRWDDDLDADDCVPGWGRWRVAAAQEHTVLTVPFVEKGIQITMIDRDAIVVGPGVKIVSTDGGNFSAEFVTTLADVIPVHQKRGWVEAQVRRRNVPLTFVGVHLEVKEFGPLQSIQAQQLLGILGTTEPLVLVGDFNSAPTDDPYHVGSAVVPTPYQLLSSALTDAWTVAGEGAGLTCCRPADLKPNPPASDLYERVDLVFLRGGFTVKDVKRTGLDPVAALGNRWPSDHAGVVANLRIQKPAHGGDDDEEDDDDGPPVARR